MRLQRCGLRRRSAFHARPGRLKARLRVDEKLSGDDDLVAFGESLADFAFAAGFDAELDVMRSEFAFVLGHDYDAALAGAYDRFRRHEQRLGSRDLCEN